MTSSADSADRSLAAQYEAYPYPARDPRDEAKRLLIGTPSHLREIDHHVFAAARPASRPLRALVAGCGTGDGAIMLATQLAQAGRPGHVTCIDRSEASLAIARARAEARGLTNISFSRASLLDLPQSGWSPFDYIDCCGVLHHLPEPDAGLRALVSVLADDGGMGLMVYAPHGRTGVYMLQDALRLLAPADEAPAMRLDAARRMMRHLPGSAWLRANRNFSDHLTGGDAGLYDLLLNPRDVAYDIPGFLAFLDRAGLQAASLMEPLRYDPALLLPDPKLRARIGTLDRDQRAALAEALAGNMNVHIAYVVRRGARPALPDPLDPDAVPVAREMPGEEIARRLTPDGSLPVAFNQLEILLPLPREMRSILPLVDGSRTVAALAEAAIARGLSRARFEAAWPDGFRRLEAANRLLWAAPAAVTCEAAA